MKSETLIELQSNFMDFYGQFQPRLRRKESKMFDIGA